MSKVAILMTCHNRVDTTLECLRSLDEAYVPDGLLLDVFLVDDGSSDDTGKMVNEGLPHVTVIWGSGDLFWCGGMRAAWSAALNSGKDHDFFLWLNDDVILFRHAIRVLFQDYRLIFDRNGAAIVLGAFRDAKTGCVTYSGRRKGVKIEPNGSPQICDYITGNFVLVPKEIYESIGMLSEKFTHGIADNDYGYRAQKAGFECYVTSEVVGTCELNSKIKWFDPSLSFRERKAKLFSKTGGNIGEYLVYVREHRGLFAAVGSAIKSGLKLFFPNRF